MRSASRWRSGVWPFEVMAMHFMPAALAAVMPAGASSKTTQRAGSTPTLDAARRKHSGSGFERFTSRPVTTASKAATSSRPSMARCTLSGGPDEPTAVRKPAARSDETSSRAPSMMGKRTATISR